MGCELGGEGTLVLRELLAPRSVAVVGASEVAGKVGTGVFRNLMAYGYSGAVYPVNAKGGQIAGHRVYRSLGECPAGVELAILCTPSASIPGLVRECGELGIRAVLVITAGFRELGAEGEKLEGEFVEAYRAYPGMRVLGPNCLGLIHPASGLSASFANGMPKAGSLAFLSQSGALCTALLDWSLREGVGFSHFVSVGNQVDVGFADLLDYLVEDTNTRAAMLYIESIPEPKAFMAAASRFAKRKPLIAYKAGRFAQSAHAACSHTGAMAGEDAVYQAALDRCGVHRVMDMASMIECAELLGEHVGVIDGVQGPLRVAIVTNAGGPGVMASDCLLGLGGQLAEVSPQTLAVLDSFLPMNWSRGNPIDVIGDATPERFARAVEVVMNDAQVDLVLAMLSPQSMTDPTETARLVAQGSYPKGKCLLTSWLGGDSMQPGIEVLQSAGIRNFEFPEQAIRGVMDLWKDTQRRRRLQDEESWDDLETVEGVSESSSFSKRIFELVKIDSGVGEVPMDRSVMLNEVASKRMLRACGIHTPVVEIAKDCEEATMHANRMGYPIVLKVLSSKITHKTDVGGVVLDLKTPDALRSAYETMMQRVKEACSDAPIDGVSVQPMMEYRDGVELILGCKRDPLFGPVILVGYGGVTAELFADRVLELLPIGRKRAEGMLKRLQCWPLLNGYRGRPSLQIESVVRVIVQFAQMCSQCEWIEEIDINPLLVTPDEAVVLDARVLVSARRV